MDPVTRGRVAAGAARSRRVREHDRRPVPGDTSHDPGYLMKNEYVARHLREMVISGEMAPGTRVRQQQIAVLLGVSATPVREAIRQLQSEGYFTSSPHVGAKVADLHRAGLDEVYRLRAMLEGYLAKEAASRMTPGKLEELATLAEGFRSAVTKRRAGLVEARHVNYLFHRRIWESAELPLTLSIVESLWGKFPRLLGSVPGRDVRSVKEHKRLLTALSVRDSNAAQDAVVEHVESARRDYHRSLRTRPVARSRAPSTST